jgi:hypothetical protein
MDWAGIAIVFLIFFFAFLLIWSKYENQHIIDTLNEIKDFIKSLNEAQTQ